MQPSCKGMEGLTTYSTRGCAKGRPVASQPTRWLAKPPRTLPQNASMRVPYRWAWEPDATRPPLEGRTGAVVARNKRVVRGPVRATSLRVSAQAREAHMQRTRVGVHRLMPPPAPQRVDEPRLPQVSAIPKPRVMYRPRCYFSQRRVHQVRFCLCALT